MAMAGDQRLRAQWRDDLRSGGRHRDGTALLMVLAACLAFWAVAAYGLSLIV